MKDTSPYNTWRYYGEQDNDKILAYAVMITENEGGTMRGNLYELDFLQQFQRIAAHAIPADTYTLIYEHGSREQPAKQYFDGNPDPQLGKFEHFEAQPNDPEALSHILREEKRDREKLKPGDLGEHIAALHDKRIETEARRILSEFQALKEPNSPNKTHFMVEVSPYFMQLASSKDTDRLLAMFPFKTLTLGNLKDRHGVFAMVAKDENRDKGIRKPRPSVRAQLTEGKAAATPKKAAAHTKSNQAEVSI